MIEKQRCRGMSYKATKSTCFRLEMSNFSHRYDVKRNITKYAYQRKKKQL